jgi:S1-C subfamily serine protease
VSALSRFSDDLAALLQRVVPCTVSLVCTDEKGPRSTASGFVFDGSGHVLTNEHVVEGARPAVEATIGHGRPQLAHLVGVDPLTDLAVLRLEHPIAAHLSLRALPPRLGEVCLAVGSPFGVYPESVSLGVVSGVARSIPQTGGRPIERAIQTDAAINPGNSGGPLVDVDGLVLGVNQCRDTRGEGIGFAIPADTVAWVAEEILSEGKVERAALGISVRLEHLEVEGRWLPRLRVTKVRAEPSLFARGDVILALDGEVVDERADLFDLLTKERIGEPTRVEVLRDGEIQVLTVVPLRWAPDSAGR